MDNNYNMDDKFKIEDNNKEDEIEVLELWEPHADEILDAKDRHVKWSKKTTNRVVILLVALAALLLMWYAVFAQPLASNNKQYQKEGVWDIQFTDMQDISTNKGLATGSYSFDKDIATFNVTFTEPGEEIVYELLIENKGELDVVVASINVVPEVIENDVITYKVENIAEGDRLDSKEKRKMKFSIKYNGSGTHDEKFSKEITIHINYDQA